VAAVVGTLLALLVFLAIFGIFLSDYLPLWMQDNEESFSATVANQFGNIQDTMGKLYLNSKTGFAVANPVTMQSDSVPVFSQPTQGVLSFLENKQLYTNLTFHLQGSGQWFSQNVTPAGELTMSLPNRYYVPITFSLQDGAVIQAQPGAAQQIMLFSPSVLANSSGQQSSLYITLYAAYGNSTQESYIQTDNVYTSLIGSQQYPGRAGTAVYDNFTTEYSCAWSKYWNSTFSALNATGYPATVSVVPNPSVACSTSAQGGIQMMHVSFSTVTNFMLTVVAYNVDVGVVT
jgi:hypothetical protein